MIAAPTLSSIGNTAKVPHSSLENASAVLDAVIDSMERDRSRHSSVHHSPQRARITEA